MSSKFGKNLPSPKLNTIADRIKYLLEDEGISTYEFCKQENLIEQRRAFEYALSKGKGDHVSATFIKAVFNRYKDKVSMIWLFYGDDDSTVTMYLNKIKELEDRNLKVSDIINKSYLEIREIVEKNSPGKKPQKK